MFINPGNPTGQCLPAEDVTRLVQWCAEHRVVLLADEVYQELVYDRWGRAEQFEGQGPKTETSRHTHILPVTILYCSDVSQHTL